MEQLDFQVLLTENYYINPNGIHISFPIKIKGKTNNALDRDADLTTANDFFAHRVKEISIKKYCSDKEPPPPPPPDIFSLENISILRWYFKIFAF